MHSFSYWVSVRVVVLFLIRKLTVPDDLVNASTAEKQPTIPPAEDFTEIMREHNALLLKNAVGSEVDDARPLTPEQAALLLAASWRAASNESLNADPNYSFGGVMKGRDLGQQTNTETARPSGSVGGTLQAVSEAAEKARQQLSGWLGLSTADEGFIRWWTQTGAPTLKNAMTSLFGANSPQFPANPEFNDVQTLLAALSHKGQPEKQSALLFGGPLPKQNAGETTGDGMGASPGAKAKPAGTQALRRQQYPPSAAGGAAPAAREERGAERVQSKSGATPALSSPDMGLYSVELAQLLKTLYKQGGDQPFLQVLEGDRTGKPMDDVWRTVAGAFAVPNAERAEAEGLQVAQGLSSLLPLGLPSMRFSALSLLTEGETVKNWNWLVERRKEQKALDYTSPAAVDVMEKLAVVLACAYKTAKTFLGDEQAISLIRAVMRQNASFSQQIFSAVKKNLGGVGAAEEAKQQGGSILESFLPPASADPMDLEARLVRELLVQIIHMPPSFFMQASDKHRETLAQWGVDPREVQSIVAEALMLRTAFAEETGVSQASRVFVWTGRRQDHAQQQNGRHIGNNTHAQDATPGEYSFKDKSVAQHNHQQQHMQLPCKAATRQAVIKR